MKQDSLIETVKRAKNGDSAAMGELYEQTSKMVYFNALKFTGNEADAQDVTQDVFVTVITKLSELKDEQTFPKWLKTITINYCKNFCKKKKPMLFSTDEEEEQAIGGIEELSEEFLPEVYADKQEGSRIIMDIIDRLPEKQKIVIIMYYFDEMSVAEIAQELETSENTVKSRLNYARAKIKDEVELIEKTQDIRLHAVPVPMFGLVSELLKLGAESSPVPQGIFAKAIAASGTSAAVTAAAATTTTTATGVGVGVKAVIGTVAASVIIGTGALAASGMFNKEIALGTLTVINRADDDIISDAVFNIEGSDGSIYTLISNSDGIATMENLPIYLENESGHIEYTVTLQNPIRYEPCDSQKVTLDKETAETKIVFDSVTKKTDYYLSVSADDLMSQEGLVFEIVDEAGTYKESSICNADNIAVFKDIPIYNADNQIISYSISEVNTPTRYYEPNPIKGIHLQENEGNATSKLNQGEIKNRIKLGALCIEKVDENGNGIKGVNLELYTASEYELGDGRRMALSSGKTDTDGIIIFNDLPLYTEYVVEEKSISKKFIRADEPVRLYLEDTNAEKLSGDDYSIRLGYRWVSLTSVRLNVHITDEIDGIPVLEAVFELIDSSGKSCGKKTTDAEGNTFFGNIQNGTYTLIEKSVPEGYSLPEESQWEIIVSASEIPLLPDSFERTIDLEVKCGKIVKTEPVAVEVKPEQPVNTFEKAINATKLKKSVKTNSELDKYVDNIFGKIHNDKMSTYEKIKACYDWLVANVRYDKSYAWTLYMKSDLMGYKSGDDYVIVEFALSALKNKKGVCDDFTAAFFVMMQRLGVDAHYCMGQVKSVGGGYIGHSWAVIKCDNGEIYQFDAMLDASTAQKANKKSSNLYFAKPDGDTLYRDRKMIPFGGFEKW